MARCRIRRVHFVCLMIGAFLVQPQQGLCRDSFYQTYLLQRMRIAALRIQKGESSARELMASLVMEAKRRGMDVPNWVSTKCLSSSMSASSDMEKPQLSFTEIDSLIRDAAAEHRLPSALIKAVVKVESAFVLDAVSRKGALGLMQLMPGTAKDIGVEDPFDPAANIFGGAMLLRKYLDEFRSLKKVLIAYNAGPEWVRKKKGIPTETRRYIRDVIVCYESYSIK